MKTSLFTNIIAFHRWTAIVELARADHSRLEQNVARSRGFVERVAALEGWLTEANHDHLAKEYTVHSLPELEQLQTNFEVESTQMSNFIETSIITLLTYLPRSRL